MAHLWQLILLSTAYFLYTILLNKDRRELCITTILTLHLAIINLCLHLIIIIICPSSRPQYKCPTNRIDIIGIVSFIIGLQNLELNKQQVASLQKEMTENQDGMLKTIIGQNEKIIRFLKKFIA